jgi:hypothetical protein
MSVSEISIPMSTRQFLELAQFLKDQGSDRDPVDAVHAAVEYWMENASWKKETLLPEAMAKNVDELQKGYFWKKLFLPSGTKARIVYKGKTYFAEVKADGLHYASKVLTPSGFVHEVTRTSRNAWNDIEVRLPEKDTWLLAADLRRDL